MNCKALLLDIEGIMPDALFVKKLKLFWTPNRRAQWVKNVKFATTSKQLMCSLLLLENLVAKEWIERWWRSNTYSTEISLRNCNEHSLYMRLLTFDMAISYRKIREKYVNSCYIPIFGQIDQTTKVISQNLNIQNDGYFNENIQTSPQTPISPSARNNNISSSSSRRNGNTFSPSSESSNNNNNNNIDTPDRIKHLSKVYQTYDDLMMDEEEEDNLIESESDFTTGIIIIIFIFFIDDMETDDEELGKKNKPKVNDDDYNDDTEFEL